MPVPNQHRASAYLVARLRAALRSLAYRAGRETMCGGDAAPYAFAGILRIEPFGRVVGRKHPIGQELDPRTLDQPGRARGSPASAMRAAWAQGSTRPRRSLQR